MSSNTRVRVKPRMVPKQVTKQVTRPIDGTLETVKVEGGQVLSLDEILGDGGRKRLLETLESLPEMKKSLNPAEIPASFLAWKEGEDGSYRLTLTGEALPKLKGDEGNLDSFHIDLKIGSLIAEVQYDGSFKTIKVGSLASSQGSNLTARQQILQRTANRAVNQLLAVAVQRRIEQQVKQYVGVKLKHTIQMMVTNQGNIQTHAYIRK